MIHLKHRLFLILIPSIPRFSQAKIDTDRTDKETRDGRKQINSNALHEISNGIQFLTPQMKSEENKAVPQCA